MQGRRQPISRRGPAEAATPRTLGGRRMIVSGAGADIPRVSLARNVLDPQSAGVRRPGGTDYAASTSRSPWGGHGGPQFTSTPMVRRRVVPATQRSVTPVPGSSRPVSERPSIAPRTSVRASVPGSRSTSAIARLLLEVQQADFLPHRADYRCLDLPLVSGWSLRRRWDRVSTSILREPRRIWKARSCESIAVAAAIESQLYPVDPNPQAAEYKAEKAAKLLQSLAKRKAAEKKSALESIKRRQEEAKLKHEKARAQAAKITEAKKQLMSLGQAIKIEDVLALVREENKDIEEAASSGMTTTVVATGSRPKQLEARRRGSSLRRAAPAQAPMSAIAAAQRSVLSKVAEEMPPTQEEAILEPEEVVKIILTSEVVEPPPGTSEEVAREELLNHSDPTRKAQKQASLEMTRPPTTPGQADEELMKGYATLFGDETEMLLYMKETAENAKAWLENATLGESMLLDESDIGEPEEFLDAFDKRKAAAEEYREALTEPPEIKVQLRGSQPPPWFPGYFTVLPQAAPPRFLLSRSPSQCLASAWRACRPNEFTDNAPVLIHQESC